MKNVLSFIMVIFVALSVVSCNGYKEYNEDNKKDYTLKSVENIDTSLAVSVIDETIFVFQKEYEPAKIDSLSYTKVNYSLKYESITDMYFLGWIFGLIAGFVLGITFKS